MKFLVSNLILVCALIDVSECIVGGQDAFVGEVPYIVQVQHTFFGFPIAQCAGAIYTDSWVITSAGCLYDLDLSDPSYVQVVAGSLSPLTPDGSEQVIPLIGVVIHNNYNPNSNEDDIALLQLSQPLTFNFNVSALALSASNFEETGGNCVVAGWGALASSNPTPPDTLQRVSVPYVTDDDCRVSYGEPEITKDMLCAGVDGSGFCLGDEGAPLKCFDGGEHLAGIASWSYLCAESGYPNVYTQISRYVNWIENNSN